MSRAQLFSGTAPDFPYGPDSHRLQGTQAQQDRERLASFHQRQGSANEIAGLVPEREGVGLVSLTLICWASLEDKMPRPSLAGGFAKGGLYVCYGTTNTGTLPSARTFDV